MARRPRAPIPTPDLPPSEPPKRTPPKGFTDPEIRKLIDPHKRYTVEEVRKQVEFIEGLMVLGAANSSVVAQASRPVGVGGAQGGLGISKHRTKMLIQRIIARWEEEDRVRSTSRRSEAARRILRQIQNCQGRRDPRNPLVWLEKPNHHALARYEEQLMKLQGTAAPIEIDINVRHSETMVAVFSRYSLETLRAFHLQAQTKKRLAAAYLEEHPEAREAIEAEGVTIE